MTKTNYSDLTITKILELAAGDLDASELAHRLRGAYGSMSEHGQAAGSPLARL
jgi:hypothetical protein